MNKLTPQRRRARCCLAACAVVLLCGCSKHAVADEFDGSARNTMQLSKEQLAAFLKQFQKSQNTQASQSSGNIIRDRRSRGWGNRRKVLYDLSVRAHYERLLHGQEWDASSSFSTRPDAAPPDSAAVSQCEYFNDGMLISLREMAEQDDSFFSHFSHWTYKLCPMRSISQMHLEPVTIKEGKDDGADSETVLKLPSKSILSSSIQFRLPKVYSLGTYLPPFSPDYASQISAAWGPDEATALLSNELAEYYIDGDLCEAPDEDVARRRQGKVIYDTHCCARRKNMMQDFFLNDGQIMIRSTSEPEPCRYILNACRVCPVDEGLDGGNRTTDEAKVDSTQFSSLLDTFLHYPPSKTEGASEAFPPMPPSKIEANKQLIQSMFTHAYDSYFYNAFPASELKPLTCQPGRFDLVKIPALTLIDTLDTLIIMGNYTEFARSVERIRYLDEKMKDEFHGSYLKTDSEVREGERGGLFALNVDVSVFETTIRVLGGLLSAHQLAVAFMEGRVPMSDVVGPSGDVLTGYDPPDVQTKSTDDSSSCSWEQSPCVDSGHACSSRGRGTAWEYDGIFLDLAHDIGKRLLFAFDTETGIPYGTVNLLHGIPPDETTVASLAGAGTLSLEFELLSRLTGDKSFGKAAKLATRALWMRRHKELKLFGKHIDTASGKWTEYLSGIGSNSDSFYEYLLKHYTLFPDDADFWPMFKTVYSGVHEHSRLGEWYPDVDLGHGLNGHVRQVFESLMAFYPGLQVLLGELVPSAKTLNSFFLVREFLGLLPERFNFAHWKTEGSGDVHPLRPELLESCYFLHLASIGLHGSHSGPCSTNSSSSHTSSWLWAADFALHTVHKLSWTPCGFATVTSVSAASTGSLNLVEGNRDPQTEQEQLNIQHHNEMPSYFLSETLKYLWLTFDAESNILHTDSERDWIFTTEAHPIHYAPLSDSKAEGGDRLNKQLEQVRALLKEKLSNTPPSSDEESGDQKSRANANIVSNLAGEQWTNTSPEAIYIDDIGKVESSDIASKESTAGALHFESGPPLRKSTFTPEEKASYGIFRDEIAATNLAHRRYTFESHGKGTGSLLAKRCPNYHHPDLLWSHALHGEAMDYNSQHVSSVSNVEHAHVVDERMLTALASVCFFGTDFDAKGIHVDESRSCPIEDAPDHTVGSNRHSELQSSMGTPIPGSTRYDMGGDLGAFDVSAFPGGDGFIVRHVGSDELLELSIFTDDIPSDPFQESQSTSLLVVLTVPATREINDAHSNDASISPHLSSRRSSGKNWSVRSSSENVDSVHITEGTAEEEAEPEHAADGHQRHVVVADLDGNSFKCEVVVTKKDRESLRAEELLASFPCSPAFFGLANLPKLIESGGEIVRGVLFPPPSDDEFGCRPLDDGSLIDEDVDGILMVRRGECNFMAKARTAAQGGHEGVLVVNSHPDELFVMAGETPEPEGGTDVDSSGDDLPVSVLVSGKDGLTLTRLLNDEQSKGNGAVEATIMLTKESDHYIRFPHVKGSADALQILAKNGWGIHAVPQAQPGERNGWQLFITQHDKKE